MLRARCNPNTWDLPGSIPWLMLCSINVHWMYRAYKVQKASWIWKATVWEKWLLEAVCWPPPDVDTNFLGYRVPLCCKIHRLSLIRSNFMLPFSMLQVAVHRRAVARSEWCPLNSRWLSCGLKKLLFLVVVGFKINAPIYEALKWLLGLTLFAL